MLLSVVTVLLRHGISVVGSSHLIVSSLSSLLEYLGLSVVGMVFQGQDAWRRHPSCGDLKDPLPGIKKAAVIYGAYLGCEYTYRYLTA
jgi:hypothetical protein